MLKYERARVTIERSDPNNRSIKATNMLNFLLFQTNSADYEMAVVPLFELKSLGSMVIRNYRPIGFTGGGWMADGQTDIQIDR